MYLCTESCPALSCNALQTLLFNAIASPRILYPLQRRESFIATPQDTIYPSRWRVYPWSDIISLKEGKDFSSSAPLLVCNRLSVAAWVYEHYFTLVSLKFIPFSRFNWLGWILSSVWRLSFWLTLIWIIDYSRLPEVCAENNTFHPTRSKEIIQKIIRSCILTFINQYRTVLIHNKSQ